MLKKYLIIILFSLNLGCESDSGKYLKSPFSNLDTLSTNDWWNRDNNPIINLKVERDEVIAFWNIYCFKKCIKTYSTTFPLYPNESREVILEIFSKIF